MKNNTVTVIIMAMAFAFSSCENVTDAIGNATKSNGEFQSAIEPGKGAIKVTLEQYGETGARTVKPQINLKYGVIHLVPYQDTPFGPVTVEFSGASKIVNVFPGEYKLDAYMYAEPNDSLPIAKGNLEKTVIEAGKTTYTTVTLQLIELTSDYTGYGNLTWRLPDESLLSTIVDAKITVKRDNSIVETVDLLNRQNNEVRLPVGYYTIQATFNNIYGAVTQVNDVLWVIKNHEAVFDLSWINGTDFNATPGKAMINWKIDVERDPVFITDVKEVEPGSVIIFEIEDQGYTKVSFYVDGTLVQAGKSTSCTLRTTGLSAGSHEVQVLTYGQNNIPVSVSVRFVIKMGQAIGQQNSAKAITVNGQPVVIRDSTPNENGGIYAVGHTNDTGILLNIDKDGNIVWYVVPTATTGKSYLNGVVTYNHDIYVAASYTGSLNFGSGTVTGPSSVDNPLALKFNSSGKNVWAKTSLDGNSWGAYGRIVANESGVYVTGWFYGSRNLGDGVIVKSNSGLDSPLLVAYSHAGKTLWGITSTQNRCACAGAIALDNNTIFVVGYTNGSPNSPFSFSNLPALIASGFNYNSWVGAFDFLTGAAKWVALAPVGGSSYFTGVTIDKDGFVYCTGYYNPSVYALSEDTNNDRGLLVKYDIRNGNVVWSKIDESAGRMQDVQADVSGLFVTSYRTVGGIKQPVLQKYDLTTGNPQFIKTANGNTDGWYGKISIDNDSVFIAGVQKGTGSFTYDNISEPVTGNSSAENGVFIRYQK